MLLVTRTQTRPSTDTPFLTIYSPDVAPELRKHFITTYKETGKVLHAAIEESTDGLVSTSTMLWDSAESYNEYRNDQVINDGYAAIFAAHNEYHSIVTDIATEEV
jgi:hypothetical protein